MAINNSKKISELRGFTVMPQHPENSWLAVAQYNSRTDTYSNIKLNIQAIIDYCQKLNDELLEKYHFNDWLDVWHIGFYEDENGNIIKRTDFDEIGYYIAYTPITQNLFSYTASYTSSYTIRAIDYFAWQGFPTFEDNMVDIYTYTDISEDIIDTTYENIDNTYNGSINN